ncbi:ABC transporter substrate-binding protein [Microbacterium ulmi]|uniref:ABC transporter substrate-binding protein n=1 Tax=Microbacterium ulmi TaxID=179095 RepID=A0A7Y2LZW0_9MICO|nr:ABC transporter substrate-binding protein [Microbacterium ulmi]NII68938.1 polar amino acid transport system substrate-binding protein [Microbacterium ulmi]NNH03921.1 ABC transporter substrate-binding protein [Microbacterium ulmi]
MLSGLATAAVALVALTGCAPESSPAQAAGDAPDVVATIESDSLVRAGHLTTCMDMPYQPFQYFDAAGDPVGVDIDLITEVAARLGLEPNFQNSVFDTIIAAVKGGKCDLIWADQYVTPERMEQLDMVAYWRADEVVVVTQGNPNGVGTRDELCGVKVAGQKGGADVEALEALSAECVAAGDEPINILQFPRSPDAYQALASGQVDAWMTEKVAALLLKQEKKAKIEFTDTFTLGDGDTAGLTAFSFRPDDAAVSEPVMAAVQSMVDDGTWAKIWDDWGLADIAVDPHKV